MSRVSFVGHARDGMSGITDNYRPMTCNESVLGWLLKAMGKTHPWQCMCQIRAKCNALNIGDWMWTHLFNQRTRLNLNNLTGGAAFFPAGGAVQFGDILILQGAVVGTMLAHSMVVVAGYPVRIRGYNNFGTFAGVPGINPPPGVIYDPHDRDCTVAGLWHGAAPQTFGAASRPLYRVTYEDAVTNLDRLFSPQAAVTHFTYSWFRTPGWQHTGAGPCPVWCPD